MTTENFPAVKDDQHEDLTAAMRDYVQKRATHADATTDLKKAKDSLLESMQEHGLTTYEPDDDSGQRVRVTDTVGVKVEKIDGGEE